METDVLILFCNVFLFIALGIVIILIVLGLKPVRWEKKVEGQNTCITITAKRNIDRVIVKTFIENDVMVFERKRIRKGQKVDFVFQTSKKPIQLIIEAENGHPRTFDV